MPDIEKLPFNRRIITPGAALIQIQIGRLSCYAVAAFFLQKKQCEGFARRINGYLACGRKQIS